MCGHYARFLILTYAAARGIHRDKISIAARAKHCASNYQHLGIRRAIRMFTVRIVKSSFVYERKPF